MGLILACSILACLVAVAPKNDSAAAWVQAFGSIAAIVAGAAAIQWQVREQQSQVERIATAKYLEAGNFGLVTVAAQYMEMLRIRKTLREQLAHRSHNMPEAPIWLLAPPIDNQHAARTLDFRSLSFLFGSSDGLRTYDQLLLAEQRYEFLRGVCRQMLEGVKEIQTLIAPHAELSFSELLDLVSIDKSARTTDLLRSALWATASEAAYHEAFASLRSALISALGEHPSIPVSMSPPLGFGEADLPELPRALMQEEAYDFTIKHA